MHNKVSALQFLSSPFLPVFCCHPFQCFALDFGLGIDEIASNLHPNFRNRRRKENHVRKYGPTRGTKF